MIEQRIVRRYAAALLAAAQKADIVDRVESDLGLVSYVFETTPKLMQSVSSPVLPARTKKSVIGEIFADKIHEITLNYIYLLIDKRREEAIPLTECEYLALANEARGIIKVQVISAVKLNDDEEARLTEKLKQITGKSVVLEKRVDSDLIGGIKVQVGDNVIDGTIKGHLEELKNRLES